MSCHNYCSGNHPLVSLGSPCHIPVASSVGRYSPSVSVGDALCLPSSCQDRTWILSNGQETCSEPTGCQPADCGPSSWETSSCPSSGCYVPRPGRGTSCLPASSYLSGSCLSVSYRPLTYVASSWRPSGLLPCGYRPSGSLSCGPQPISIVSSGLRPLRPVFSGCQTLPYVFSPYRPSCSTCGGL
ncbi:hypothetical protein Celaphus_00019446 [Cervus elaphus hippelaphus]|uniref:Keratin-associated protein n=1 Tax=Cervus elaphus hippelaphus TaxID=46360 RepID=A0A212C3H3_CEREH|nr:keratin-associated protein 26-1 [Cervus elaphus]OWK00543.1 hypothetical protein Celaphus_00019446 [Cervus elaphus hippelaphus]